MTRDTTTRWRALGLDAIRAEPGREGDASRSIAKTDAAYGVRKGLLAWGGAR